MSLIRFAILGAALCAGIHSAAATPRLVDAAALTTPLGCQIRNVKIVVITNTTASTIPAGTRISYDMVRIPDGAHIAGSVSSGTLAPGASFQLGGWQSTSCTASMPRVLMMAP